MPVIANKEILINEEIKDKEVRVIGVDGSQLGILPIKEALSQAVAANLDLVEIAPQALPPVCRIMDFGKFCFEQAKKEKEARKNQRVIEIKEIRLSVNIDTNDFNTKLKSAIKFLKGGDKVKLSLRFRGREMAHIATGREQLEKFTADIAEYGIVEKMPKLEGRSMTMFITPKNPTK